MSALATIFDEMADQIREALAGSDWDIQVVSRALSNPTVPSIDMYEGDPATESETANFGATAADMAEGHVFNVRARVSSNDQEGNQDVLLALSDPEDELCLVQAVYDDATLGGHVMDVQLLSKTGLTLFPTNDGSSVHYGCLWRFLVIPARS